MEDQPGTADFVRAVPAPPVYTEHPNAFLPKPSRETGPLRPWLSIWVRPRETMRRILASDPRRQTLLLAALGGIAASIGSGRSLLVDDEVPDGALLPIMIAAGAVAAIPGLYLGGWLIRLTSRWFEGRGDSVATRAAIAWSNVPAIWGLLLWVPMISAFGLDGLTLRMADLEGDTAGQTLVVLVGVAELAIGAWGVVILLKCLGEAHGFSAWRALAALTLALLIAAAPFALVLLAANSF